LTQPFGMAFWKDYLYVAQRGWLLVESKNDTKLKDIEDFRSALAEVGEYFPQYASRPLRPIFASLHVSDHLVKYCICPAMISVALRFSFLSALFASHRCQRRLSDLCVPLREPLRPLRRKQSVMSSCARFLTQRSQRSAQRNAEKEKRLFSLHCIGCRRKCSRKTGTFNNL